MTHSFKSSGGLSPATPPERVTIREVGLRDGLQSLPQTLPIEHKLQWLQGAVAAGIRDLEVGSFVPAKLLPQLADTAEVVAAAKERWPHLTISVLVPNLKGAERALQTKADAMLLPLSASHAHSLANLRKTPDEVLQELARIRALRDAQGSHCQIEVGISTAFGCTIQGQVAVEEVLRLVRAAHDAGAEHIGLADTVGYANPRQVNELFQAAARELGQPLAFGHFHDTRGLGPANAYAAWQTGVACFDSSLGGIGGCPHAPGASGNVATEDLAFLFTSMGVQTGINAHALLTLRQKLAEWLGADNLHGTVARAGLPKTFPLSVS